jgi:hypothetical protein
MKEDTLKLLNTYTLAYMPCIGGNNGLYKIDEDDKILYLNPLKSNIATIEMVGQVKYNGAENPLELYTELKRKYKNIDYKLSALEKMANSV